MGVCCSCHGCLPCTCCYFRSRGVPSSPINGTAAGADNGGYADATRVVAMTTASGQIGDSHRRPGCPGFDSCELCQRPFQTVARTNLGGGHCLHGNRKSDGGDVYRVFVESSWHANSAVLSLLAAKLNMDSKTDRKTEWVQLSGHSGAFSVASSWSVWKRLDPDEVHELLAYRQLMQEADVRKFVPAFYREVEHQGDYFLELEDLTQHFASPSIMDVKMGCRTFLESEASNAALRPDLYKKMLAVDPDQPTEEERRLQAITKLRYMRFREEESTTVSLGFRLDAIKTRDTQSCAVYSQKLKAVKTEGEVSQIMHYFCGFNPSVMQSFAFRLRQLKSALENSSFFATHEFIGSSLLFLHDDSQRSGVWMIDFAKTLQLAEGNSLTHTVQWAQGSQEDGYMIGLDNLIRILDSVSREYV